MHISISIYIYNLSSIKLGLATWIPLIPPIQLKVILWQIAWYQIFQKNWPVGMHSSCMHLQQITLHRRVNLVHWKWLPGKCFSHFRVFVLWKIRGQLKIFSWSTENKAIFFVKCFTDLKRGKHFTNFYFSFFFRKIFSRKSFFKKYFPEIHFQWNKQSLTW